MKERKHFYRVCYYWNSFDSDGAKFSDSSTNIHILGGVYKKPPTREAMIRLLAKEDDLLEDGQVLEFAKPKPRNYGIQVVDFAEVKKEIHYGEEKTCFVGALRIPRGSIKPISGIKPITRELLDESCNYQDMGISDIGRDIEGDIVLIMEGHDFFPLWKLHGYDNSDEALEKIKIYNYGFSDENFRCDVCSTLMPTVINTWYSNRMFVDECECVGTTCGCYKDYCLDNVGEFLDNPEKAIDPDAMAVLKEKGLVTHHSDLCSGWSCGRDSPEKAIEEIYEEAELGLFDVAEQDDEDFTEGMLFQVDCLTPFDTGFSMWIYKNRQNTNKQLLEYLQEAYEGTDWLEPGDKITVISTANSDVRGLWEEYYPDRLGENNVYTMYSTIIIKEDGSVNEDFALTEPKGSEYNALRAGLIELDTWENVHDRKL